MVGSSGFDFKYKMKERSITIEANNCQYSSKPWSSVVLPKINSFHSTRRRCFYYKLCAMPKSLFHKKVLMNEVHKPALKSHLFDQQELSQCIIPAKYPLCSWWGDIIAKTSMDCWKHVWWNMSIPQKVFAEQLWDSWKHNSRIWWLLAFFYKG